MLATTPGARRRPGRAVRAGALAAALVAALLGCPAPGGDRTLPALPAVEGVMLWQAGQVTALAWAGVAARVLVTVRDLGGAAGPLRLSATRIATFEGGATSGPEVAVVVQAPAGGAPQVLGLDLPADHLQPGRWRVALHDARGLLASLDAAFLVATPPTITEVEWTATCTTRASRDVTLRGANLLAGPASLGVPRVTAVLVTPLGELPMGAPTGTDCVAGSFGGRWFSFCRALRIPLPDQPAAVGEVVLRLPAGVAPPPGGPLAAPLAYEAQGSVPALVGRLAVVDAPTEVKVMSGGQYLVGPAGGTAARIGQTPLALRGEGCEPTGVAGLERCGALWATIPLGFPAGTHAIEVTSQTGCALAAPVELAARPVITGTRPAAVCRAGYGALTLLGEGLDTVRTTYAASTAGPWTGFSTQYLSTLPAGRWAVRAETVDVSPPLVSEPFWLDVFAGPLSVADFPEPRLLSSTSHRPVSLWVSGSTGLVSGRLLPLVGGDPVPVTLSASPASASTFTFEFPALGGDRSYWVEVADESPCGGRQTPYALETRSDPVLLAWDFELSGQAPTAYSAAGMYITDPSAGITPGAGVTGSAATGRTDADVGDWYLGWWPYVPAGDHGLIRFALEATGSGAPSSAAGLMIGVADAYGREVRLRTQLTPPTPGVWNHYEVRLDDPSIWTVTEPTGATRAATSSDLQDRLRYIAILASWWRGPVSVAVDDLSLVLATDPVGP